jgi:hypothetical protein
LLEPSDALFELLEKEAVILDPSAEKIADASEGGGCA